MFSRLRFLRPLIYRPLWPQHRLSSSLISSRKYDFSPILTELPEDFQASSQLMNIIMAISVDLTKKNDQEIMDLMKENERKREDLIERKGQEMKKEMKNLMQEKVDLMEKKEREKSELSKSITSLENEIKKRTESLLRSKRMCNVSGALEFIKSTIRSQDKTISFREPTDNVLMKLTQDTKFVFYLKQTCTLNNSQYKDVEKCMGGLYHTASKQLHGHDKDIEIDARDWSVNEVLALGVLFRYYNIPYNYYNGEGELADYPYKLAE